MIKFYSLIWLRWIVFLGVYTVAVSLFLDFFLTLFVYIKKGFPSLNEEVLDALKTVFKINFYIVFNISFLISIFLAFKHIFYVCTDNYNFVLLNCKGDEEIDVTFSELVKVFRKFLFALIWLSAVAVLMVSIVARFVFGFTSMSQWFNIYILISIVILNVYLILFIMPHRCKKVKVRRC